MAPVGRRMFYSHCVGTGVFGSLHGVSRNCQHDTVAAAVAVGLRLETLVRRGWNPAER